MKYSILLTHWGRETHICVSKLTIIGSDNGMSPGRRQAIIWTYAGLSLIEPLGTNFSEILFKIDTFLFKKMHLKMSSGKWRPFCLGLNVLNGAVNYLSPAARPEMCDFPCLVVVASLQHVLSIMSIANILRMSHEDKWNMQYKITFVNNLSYAEHYRRLYIFVVKYCQNISIKSWKCIVRLTYSSERR